MIWMKWQEGVRDSLCWIAQNHLQRLKSFPVPVPQPFPWSQCLKLLTALGLINVYYLSGRVCGIAVRAQSKLYFYLYLIGLAEGRGICFFFFPKLSAYLAQWNKEETVYFWGSWLIKIHLRWILFNSLEITVEMSETLGFWGARPCIQSMSTKGFPWSTVQWPVLSEKHNSVYTSAL